MKHGLIFHELDHVHLEQAMVQDVSVDVQSFDISSGWKPQRLKSAIAAHLRRPSKPAALSALPNSRAWHRV
jgi:hypothetical protein